MPSNLVAVISCQQAQTRFLGSNITEMLLRPDLRHVSAGMLTAFFQKLDLAGLSRQGAEGNEREEERRNWRAGNEKKDMEGEVKGAEGTGNEVSPSAWPLITKSYIRHCTIMMRVRYNCL